MKKVLLFLIIFISVPAFASVNTYIKGVLTGGGTSSLDAIDGDDLAEADKAIVVTIDGTYFYRLSASSGASENSPYVISPDVNAGNKRWLLKQYLNGTMIQQISTPDLTGNSYSVLSTDFTILINDSDADVTGSVTVTLPTASTSEGRILIIKKIGSAYDVVVDGNGTETIDKSLTKTITTQFSYLILHCDGTEWFLI